LALGKVFRNRREMKTSSPRIIGLSITFTSLSIAAALAQDASIDQLLKKLPPPEKLVKSPVERAMQQRDPALNDPLAKEITKAFRMRNFPRALDLSRKLAQRYPNSPAAACVHGSWASAWRQYPEASAAFRKAIALQPKFSFAYFGLGNVEATQGHFAAAFPNFQKVAELEPKNFAAFFFLSECARRAGRKQESVEYARRSTTLSPAAAPAWLQLARTENSVGHSREALAAVARAAELSPDNAYMLTTVGYGYINLNRIS
jgi:tetratricopeptide (TPR) repeat protein